jgi:FkbM family methyltransferase
MVSKESFIKLLKTEINNNRNNDYKDNWDYVLNGESIGKTGYLGRLNNIAGKILPWDIYAGFLVNYFMKDHLNGLAFLYNNLSDDYSRKLLIQVLAYRMLGHKKYKLPLSNQKYWDNLKLAETLIVDKEDFIDPKFLGFTLNKHDLRPIGYPITFYFTPLGVLIDFIIKQYEYNSNGKVIKAEKDDVILDCGGCWGDTALFFSNETGPGGKIYSFEFIPSNIEIYKKNLLLNPHLAPAIEIVANPVWDKSGQELFYKDFGPASTVSNIKMENSSGETATVAIDDFVKNKGVSKVNFIKMDIEGAELNAVKGARETIIKYRPKLAIAVYHHLSDFYTITEFIHALNLGYKFYFQHTTIHDGESVLFAEV